MSWVDPLSRQACDLLALSVWEFSETSGDLIDQRTGTGNDGAIVGSPTRGVLDRRGLASAYRFDGDNDWINVENNLLYLASAYTIEAVIKTTTAASQVILDERSAASTGVVLFVASDGTIRFGHYGTTCTGGAVNDGSWHHIAAVWDGADMFLYVDGVQAATQPDATAITSTAEAHIASRSYSGPSSKWNGEIAHVGVHLGVLNVAQIATLVTASQTTFWTERIYNRLIGGVGTTVSGGNITEWDSRTANGDASGGTPPSTAAPVLGRQGARFTLSNTEHLLVDDIHGPLDGDLPAFGMGILFEIHSTAVNHFLFGAGASNDEYRMLLVATNQQLQFIARSTGTANRTATFGTSSTFSVGKKYAVVLGVYNDTLKAIIRSVDGTVDSADTDSFTMVGTPSLDQGIIGARWMNGAADSPSDSTIYEAMLLGSVPSGDVTDEAAGGEIWDMLDALMSSYGGGSRQRRRRSRKQLFKNY